MSDSEVILMWEATPDELESAVDYVMTDLAAVRDVVASNYVYTVAIYDEMMRSRAQHHLALLFCAALLFSSLYVATCRRPRSMTLSTVTPTVVVAEPVEDKDVKV